MESADSFSDRSHVVYARHQWFGFALFGALFCLAALVFARWDPTTTDSRWFWIVVGPAAGVVSMFRSQSLFGRVGADRDAGPYIGMLVGTTIGALVIGMLALDGWVLPGIFFAVGCFLAFMAWMEQSGIGMTTALTVGVLAAATAAPLLEGSGVIMSLVLGLMLLAAALAMVAVHGTGGSPAEELVDLRQKID